MHAFEAVEGEEPTGRVPPPHARHGDPLVPAEVPPEGLGVPGLLLVVELQADGASELLHELVRVDEVELPHALARDARRRGHQPQVRLDLARRGRPLDLDDDLGVVRQRRSVHLADRGGRDRLLLEVEERLLDREAQLRLDDPLDVLHRERRDLVLELAKLDDDVRRHDVGSRREQLAELDEGRPQLVEHLAEASSPIAVGLAVGRAAPVEEVPEAVAGGDTADLGRAAEAALRPVVHRVSVARLGDAVALEQPEPVLELRDAECEILDFLAPRETRARRARSTASSRRAPRRSNSARQEAAVSCTAARIASRVDPDTAREIVRHLVRSLEPEAGPPDAGEEKLGDRAFVVRGLAHRGHSRAAARRRSAGTAVGPSAAALPPALAASQTSRPRRPSPAAGAARAGEGGARSGLRRRAGSGAEPGPS